jgi:hypothetical protein
VLKLSHLLIVVVLVSLLVGVVAEGSYRVWHDTDEERKSAVDALDAAAGEAQAKLVEVWKTIEKPIGFNPPESVEIHVKNNSDRRISGLVFSWRQGTAPWGDPALVSFVMPGKTTMVGRELPSGLSAGQKKLFSADVYFQDDKNLFWRATPREDGGGLVRRSPVDHTAST